MRSPRSKASVPKDGPIMASKHNCLKDIIRDRITREKRKQIKLKVITSDILKEKDLLRKDDAAKYAS